MANRVQKPILSEFVSVFKVDTFNSVINKLISQRVIVQNIINDRIVHSTSARIRNPLFKANNITSSSCTEFDNVDDLSLPIDMVMNTMSIGEIDEKLIQYNLILQDISNQSTVPKIASPPKMFSLFNNNDKNLQLQRGLPNKRPITEKMSAMFNKIIDWFSESGISFMVRIYDIRIFYLIL